MMSEALVILHQTSFVCYVVEPFSGASPLGTMGHLGGVFSVGVCQAHFQKMSFETTCFALFHLLRLSLPTPMLESVLNLLSAHVSKGLSVVLLKLWILVSQALHALSRFPLPAVCFSFFHRDYFCVTFRCCFAPPSGRHLEGQL